MHDWKDRVGSGFFLFVGALRYYKGLPFLVEAARLTGFPLVIAGEGELRADIERANLPNVRLVGHVDDESREALLDLAGAFIFPSNLRSEAFGVSLLEAARAGKPMISCELGTGTTFVNIDGETGITVPPADSTALAGAMQQLAGSPTLAASMSVAARRHFEINFTAEVMCAAYEQVYNTLR